MSRELGVTLSLAVFLLASCATGRANEVSKKTDSLTSIISSDIFKTTYAKINAEKTVEESEYGRAGMLVRMEISDSDMNPAQQFYKVCSPSQPYQSPFIDYYDWPAQLANYDQLKSDDKDDVRLFIIGVVSDGFYCGSMMQLSFPLEDAVDEARLDPAAPCIDNFQKIPYEKRYNSLFFKSIDRDPDLLKRHDRVKDVIGETLRNGVLCSI